jgi:chromosome partitioning protein
MTRTIAIANQKGGTGKTTSAINIACGWARAIGSDRVLLVDLDPQANATAVALDVGLAVGPRRPDVPTIKEVLLEETAVSDAIQVKPLAGVDGLAGFQADSNLHVLPSHLELAVLESLLSNTFRGEYRLKKQMESVRRNYDVIIVDCPPSLGTLTLNALIFCQEVLIPVDPGLFPLIGLGLLLNTIETVREANPQLHITGVLPTLVSRTVVSRDTLTQLENNFANLILPQIPQRTLINEAHTAGHDIFSFSPTSDSAEAYAAVVTALREKE